MKHYQLDIPFAHVAAVGQTFKTNGWEISVSTPKRPGGMCIMHVTPPDPYDESIEDKFATAGVNVIPEGGIEPDLQRLIDEDPFKEWEPEPGTIALRRLVDSEAAKQVGPVNPTYIAGIGEVPLTPQQELLVRYHERIHAVHQEFAKEFEGHQAARTAQGASLGTDPTGNPPGNLAEAIEEINEGEQPITVVLEPAERDIILAALRLWQATEAGAATTIDRTHLQEIYDIASNGEYDDGSENWLDDEAIDDLCERINQ